MDVEREEERVLSGLPDTPTLRMIPWSDIIREVARTMQIMGTTALVFHVANSAEVIPAVVRLLDV